MVKDWCCRECSLQSVERFPAIFGKVPRSGFPSEPGKWKDDFRVVMNESSIEIGEAKEGLNISDFPGFRPSPNCLHLGRVHTEAVGGENIAKVLNRVTTKLTLVGTSVKSVFSEPPKDFLDMSLVFRGVVPINQDIVKIDNDTLVQHVREDVVHEMLECR